MLIYQSIYVLLVLDLNLMIISYSFDYLLLEMTITKDLLYRYPSLLNYIISLNLDCLIGIILILGY